MIRKIAFLGTPQISTSTLVALVEAGYDVPLVITGADKKRGRGSGLTPSPVAIVAKDLGIPVSHDPIELVGQDFDLAVVVAYGRLISDALLAKHLYVNLHFSLLPRWRGAAPMERAILSGDGETGVSVMQLVKELDAGPVYARAQVALDDRVTLSQLATTLSSVANKALLNELDRGDEAFSEPVDQVGEATYARKLTSQDLRIDWKQSAPECLRRIRLERAWTTFGGSRFKILEAQVSDSSADLAPGQMEGVRVGTGSTSLSLVSVQPENKRVMQATEWIRGLQKSQPITFT